MIIEVGDSIYMDFNNLLGKLELSLNECFLFLMKNSFGTLVFSAFSEIFNFERWAGS
jgi:hypothetical protein